MQFRIWMHSIPAMGRTFYTGKVDISADEHEKAIEKAITRAARIHGHRDWTIEQVETLAQSKRKS